MFERSTVISISSLEQLSMLESAQVAILYGQIGPLNEEQEQSLYKFVLRGGGLLCLGDTLEAYHEYPLLGELFGQVYGRCTPYCEIIARATSPDHYMTRRVDPTFAVQESLYLLAEAPADTQVIWYTVWQYENRPLAYVRTCGQGRVFCASLGTTAETRALPLFTQMVARASAYVAGAPDEERSLRVALLGYGAIGFEHGSAVSQVPGLSYALVCDRNTERLCMAADAFPGIRTCTDAEQVAEDDTIDIVIVATPPNTHAALSLRMLRAGKHVVTEKPFCLTAGEADEMIALAEEQQRMLTIYQCRRWDPDYLAIQQIVERGTIGPIFSLETFIGGYSHPCEYWHSHQPISGGVFYDWGSHYLDWILNLIPDPVTSVRAVEHKRVWHDVTNADQSSLYLRFAGGQEALFIHSDIAAALKPKWYILGERGALVGQWRHEVVKTRRWSGDLIEHRLAPSESLPSLYVYTRESDGNIHEQHITLPQAPTFAFHRNIANHLHQGEPLAVTPQQARRTVAVMEAATQSVKQDGATIPIDC